jgi:nitroimidazol reductase NimA-like FMN-containing flavoprotein (pyridoxamine 5'-phosphate oxidase superfamily)
MNEWPTDHVGLETLPFDECLRLLGSVPVGRLGFVCDGEVNVLPVNHAVDGQDVVFHTAYGSKLAAAAKNDSVAFEVDHYDPVARVGWSVLITGKADLVLEDAEIGRLDRLGLHPWGTRLATPYWIRIRPTSVTGRRIPA